MTWTPDESIDRISDWRIRINLNKGNLLDDTTELIYSKNEIGYNKDYFTIPAGTTAGKDVNVTVLSTLGSVVYQGVSKTINTQSWKKGMYLVVVEEGNKRQTVKVIK